MDGGVMQTFYLRYWNPSSGQEVALDVQQVDEVVASVERAAEIYGSEESDSLPGVALWSEVDTPENSLNIGVASDGWAVVHTDEEFFQVASHRSIGSMEELRRVRFDDFIEIPEVCFIDKTVAQEVIHHWMISGELLDAAGFSGELY
ncbi:hypothetical protein [Streptomyces sp. NPDC087270]|uniref:hypothetical protein n=1 Tax=Streptomyces sp. NPDC087270 TaxID=3365774 RepID=UPI0038105A6D